MVRLRAATAALAMALLALAAPVFAQAPAAPPAAPPAAVSEEARAAAADLMEASGGATMGTTMLGLMRNQMVTSIQRATSKPAAEVARIVDEVLLPSMTARIGELTGVVADINAAHYTVAEMRELAAFYRSPLGRRVVAETPQIGAAAFAAGQAWGSRVAQEALMKNADELRRRGVQL